MEEGWNEEGDGVCKKLLGCFEGMCKKFEENLKKEGLKFRWLEGFEDIE